jgi:PLP dependent protein
MSIETNLVAVGERIRAACLRAGRPPEQVRLLAVSKLQPKELIAQAWAAGHRDFGENYAQELRDKAAQLSGLSDLRWHAIGPLQTNKAKYAAQVAWAFHALDRVEVAQELSRRRQGEPLRCFLEVKVGGEATKSGVEPERAQALLEQVRGLPGLQIVGVMGMPPLFEDPEQARPGFRLLRQVAERLELPELSMGTTSDFEVAIEEGAHWIRVGTAIFGEREAKLRSP